MKNILCCFLVILFFYGCESGDKSRNISTDDALKPIIININKAKEVDKSQVKLSQFAESISYIKLAENPLLGDIRHTPIKIFEDTIYVDHENVYKYTLSGEFIKKIFTEGKGPGEAIKYETMNAAFSEEERSITFMSYSNFSYVAYSFDGNFLGIIPSKIDDAKTKEINTYFRNYMIYSIDHRVAKDIKGNRIGPFLFYAKNLYDDSVFYCYPNPAADFYPEYKGTCDLSAGDMQFIHIDNELWFKCLAIDTLYSTSDLKIISPKYIFKTDKNFLDIKEYVAFKSGGVDIERAKSMKLITGVIPLPNKSLLYTINNKVGFCDNEGKVFDYSQEPIINDIDDYLKTIDIQWNIDLRTFSIYKDHLYVLVDAYLFLEEGSKSPFEDLTEDSNPVVLKIKLKK